MPSKEQPSRNDKTRATKRWPKSATGNLNVARPPFRLNRLIQQAQLDPHSLSPGDVLQLQRMIGNQTMGQLLVKKARSTTNAAEESPKLAPARDRARRVGSPKQAQSAPLNQSVQAKGGMTGQGGFFLPGAYRSGSRGKPHGEGRIQRKIEPGKMNVVGEQHEESNSRRLSEKKMLLDTYAIPSSKYRTEQEYKDTLLGYTEYGDPKRHRVITRILRSQQELNAAQGILKEGIADKKQYEILEMHLKMVLASLHQVELEVNVEDASEQIPGSWKGLPEAAKNCQELGGMLEYSMLGLKTTLSSDDSAHFEDRVEKEFALKGYIDRMDQMLSLTRKTLLDTTETKEKDIAGLSTLRSRHMLLAAATSEEEVVWKVGDEHVQDMKQMKDKSTGHVALTDRVEFNAEMARWRREQMTETLHPMHPDFGKNS